MGLVMTVESSATPVGLEATYLETVQRRCERRARVTVGIGCQPTKEGPTEVVIEVDV